MAVREETSASVRSLARFDGSTLASNKTFFASVFPIRKQREKRLKYKEMIRSGLATAELERRMKEDNRDKLVEILAFVFMPNHVHLLLRQIKPGGISLFMQKLGSGYPRYFNSRYERKGHLFQDKFASSHISGNDYLKTVFVYIHTNPISLVEPRWKEKGVENPENAITFLEGYRWSSYLDYLGKNNFPALTERSFLNGVFRDQKTIKEFVDSWIRCKSITCINNRFKQG